MTRVEQDTSQALAGQIRRLVLEQSKRANVGHIGSSLSVADVVAALYAGPLRRLQEPTAERPRFVLAKGHAALAVYAALHLQGVLSRQELDAYCMDGSLVGVHPDRALAGIDFSTGSLGQGLSFAVGSALAARLSGQERRTYVLLSDAECNEGAVWEAAMFAGHHGLSSLLAVVDVNGQQALGYTRDIQSPGSMADRWRACGWDVVVLDGHDTRELGRVVRLAPGDEPRVLLAQTTFGRGVSFMEGRIEWHYLPMSDEQFAQAIAEVAG